MNLVKRVDNEKFDDLHIQSFYSICTRKLSSETIQLFYILFQFKLFGK